MQYEWSLSTLSSPEVNEVYALAKKSLPLAIEAKLATFPQAIIDTHGKDLTVSAEPSRTGTPTPSAPTDKPEPSMARSALSQPIRSGVRANINTAVVTVSTTLQAAADDLFGLLTDEARIPSWTRAPAVSTAKPDTEYSLFGGGVKGKYNSLEQGKKIVQTWILNSPTWPSGHYATLTTSFDQSTDSTKVTWSLNGVPKGLEDEIERNLKGY
jgi:activator of HSP90 ATPase